MKYTKLDVNKFIGWFVVNHRPVLTKELNEHYMDIYDDLMESREDDTSFNLRYAIDDVEETLTDFSLDWSEKMIKKVQHAYPWIPADTFVDIVYSSGLWDEIFRDQLTPDLRELLDNDYGHKGSVDLVNYVNDFLVAVLARIRPALNDLALAE